MAAVMTKAYAEFAQSKNAQPVVTFGSFFSTVINVFLFIVIALLCGHKVIKNPDKGHPKK